jgi:hypothetical protein
MKTKTMMISFFGTAMGIIAGYITNDFVPGWQLAVTSAAASVITAILMEESNQ